MAQSDDEEDYMTMVIEEPKVHETSLQRTARLRREAQARAYTKPSAVREAEAAAERESSLDTPLDETNKGFQMLAKLGYKPGMGLGKSEDARKEPIRAAIKNDKSGIGHETVRKRKQREAFEWAGKRVKLDEAKTADYREQMRQEHLERKHTSDLRRAQKVAEELDDPDDLRDPNLEHTPLRSVPLVYRDCVRERRTEEQRRMELSERRKQSLSPDLDDYDYNRNKRSEILDALADDEYESEDDELTEFIGQPVADRLAKVVGYLREKHNYCFWCMAKYPDAEMDGCPGITEDDH